MPLLYQFHKPASHITARHMPPPHPSGRPIHPFEKESASTRFPLYANHRNRTDVDSRLRSTLWQPLCEHITHVLASQQATTSFSLISYLHLTWSNVLRTQATVPTNLNVQFQTYHDEIETGPTWIGLGPSIGGPVLRADSRPSSCSVSAVSGSSSNKTH